MNPTDHSERACELLVEHFFCASCPFKDEPNKNKACMNCGHVNIALLTSLDAWRPLWKRMDERGLLHVQELMEIVDPTVRLNEHGMYELITGELYLLMLAQPHHHLEAALRTLEDTCPDCLGTMQKPSNPDPSEPGTLDVCTCNNGKITLYEKLEREVG